MSNTILDLSIKNLAIAYVFVLLVVIIFRVRGIKRERQIIIASMRMTVQLTGMGYILLFLFQKPHWSLSLLMLCIMLGFAIYNAKKRVNDTMSKELKRLLGVSMIVGYASTAFLFIGFVLGVRPWYNPQYFIPISGMIIGNAMTGVSIGANRLCGIMTERREQIENSLMLGATPAMATRELVNEVFDGAILPTMNNMLTMGLVSIPGMMTGQILSGTFPMTAIKYQMGIMLAILGCTAITLVIFVTMGYQTFFTKEATLR